VLPNLIVAGAGKSGTSSLHLYLAQHPAIVMTTVKEPHCFSDPARAASPAACYDGLFPPDATTARYRGESSTGYMVFPDVAKRIRGTIPDCRLVFLLRNPVDRAISHFRWLVGLGVENRDFSSAFTSDWTQTPDPSNDRAGAYGYIYQESCYGTNLDRFYAQFPAEQMLLLCAEELRSDPLTCLNRCCEFLGVAPFRTVVPLSANESRTLPHPRARARLEGRSLDSGHLERRARAALRRLLGESLSSRLREAAVRSLGSTELVVPINVERTWLSGLYAADVASVRRRDPAFADAWTTDFPPEPDSRS
jgi:Sulfotransferase domain